MYNGHKEIPTLYLSCLLLATKVKDILKCLVLPRTVIEGSSFNGDTSADVCGNRTGFTHFVEKFTLTSDFAYGTGREKTFP